MTHYQPSRRVLLAGGLAALLVPFARADDKKDDKGKAAPAGAWTKKEGQAGIEFTDKETVKFYPHGDAADVTIVCSFTAEKGGVLKVKITDHDGKEGLKAKVKELLPVGTAFSFKWKATDDSATLEDMEGKEAERLKSHLEGGYEKKK